MVNHTTAYREFEQEVSKARPHLTREAPVLWERLKVERPEQVKRFRDMAAQINFYADNPA